MEIEVMMGRRERGEGGCRGDGGREQVEFREKRKRKRKGIEKEQSDRGRKGDGVNMWHAQRGAILELT